MGQRSFPREDKLRFIIERINSGASDAEIQEDLVKYGPSGRVSPGQFGAFGEVGIRTIRNIRETYEISREVIRKNVLEQDTILKKLTMSILNRFEPLRINGRITSVRKTDHQIYIDVLLGIWQRKISFSLMY